MDKSGLCIVTGASSGIGQAIAEALAATGYRVVGTARQPSRSGSASPTRPFELAALDLTSCESVDAFARWLEARSERVGLLVNNAGYGAMGPLLELDRGALELQFQTNLFGPLRLTAAIVPLMRPGSIVVSVGSISGDVTTPFAGAYCASKAALHAADDALRLELEPFGIRVVSVRPGGIRSRFGQRAAQQALVPTDGSPYAPYVEGIRARALESQTKAASPEALAAGLLRILERRQPPHVWRFGPRSLSLLALRSLLPRSLFNRALAKRYGLR